MIREQFANFLAKLREADEKGLDLDVIVKAHEHENAYIYNDCVFKKIFASEKNIALTTDLVNAALGLTGPDRIEHPKIVNPFIPGELGYRNTEPDLSLTNDRGDGKPRDRITIEVQHEADGIYKNRLLLYVSRIVSGMVKKDEPPVLENLNLISFQFTDAYPWKVSHDYVHTVQPRDQKNLLYFDKQTITVIEVKKFFDHAEVYTNDNSRLAQWLRAIDTLNREDDFSTFSRDRVFGVLQNECKLCNFSARYLMTDEMKSIDRATAVFYKQEQIAKNMLRDGDSVEKIARNTGVPLFMVNEIKKRFALEEA